MASVLIIEGRFYEDIVDELVKGATTKLEAAGVEYERVAVPGALEIPQVFSLALQSVPSTMDWKHDGVIALGCVIRGETSHYEIVANESASALLALSVDFGIPLGNGILTVESREQAKVRADAAGKNKGGDAAEACLRLMALKEEFLDSQLDDELEV